MNRHMYFRQQEKNELYHHGIKGQKWGIRRYQNEDGSYTEEGKRRRKTGKEYSDTFRNTNGWNTKILKNDSQLITLSFTGKEENERRRKANYARVIETDFDYCKKDWDKAIKESGILDSYHINKGDQKRLVNNPEQIRILVDKDEDDPEKLIAYIGYYTHGINPGNNSLSIDYDLKDLKVKQVYFDS